MRIQQISVTGLFNVFDHRIPVNTLERVTIIHGPNGYGKTVILNMISGLIDGNHEIFERVPFKEFRVDLSDGTSRIIRKAPEPKNETKTPPRLEFLEMDAKGRATETELAMPQSLPESTLNRIDRLVPSPYRRVGSGWVDHRGNKYSLLTILARFPRAAKELPKKYRPSLLNRTKAELEVLFVETNRLRTDVLPVGSEELRWLEHDVRYRDAFVRSSLPATERTSLKVDQNSQDLVQRIKSTLADYAKHSQDRDRTFPERLVRFLRGNGAPLAGSELLSRMTELESKRNRLASLGILDSEVGLHDLSEEDVKRASEALTIYVGDVDEKLGVFDDLIRRIGTLQDILNGRLPYKRLTIDRDKGMRVFSQDKTEIELKDLSSGEQHQLVVLYELLFRSPRNGLVLVDEPEISLHVAWQSDFIKDLIEILDVTDSYAIVATHSPVIIGDKWDMAIELTGPTLSRNK